MKKIKIEYGLLLFLYAYFRKIDLSLDRSRWVIWGEFQNYFKNSIGPNDVVFYLKRHISLPETDFTQFMFSAKKKSLLERLRPPFVENSFLTEDEILYCCKLLWEFQKELKSNTENYNKELEKLRIDIAHYYSKILESKILNKDLDKLMKIEHFNQSTQANITSLDQYIPDDF